MSASRRPLGPRGHWLLGSLPEFRRDLLGFLTRCAHDYGDVVYFRLGPRAHIMLNDPKDIEQVLVTENQNFIKNYILRLNHLLLGNGLVTSEGAFWLRQRRLIQPAFHRKQLASYAASMIAFTERMVVGWQDGQTRDVHADMMHLTLEIVAMTLFAADVGGEASEVGPAMEAGMESFVARLTSVFHWPEWIPTPSNVRLKRAARRLDAIIYRFIRQRRQTGEDRGDLLSILLQARDEDDGTRMTDKQLRDEMMTLFLAGHETTAIVLSWTFYLLARHPEVEAKLAAELASVLGGRSPAVADLPRLRFTERVVTESMRLYPPAYFMGREAIRDCEIAGYRVPAGMTLVMSQWVLHRDPRFFDRPDVFDPDRWADDRARKLPKFAYFPFGGGPRTCIGNHFAMMEAVLVLATVLSHFRLQLVPGHTVKPWPSVTLRPAQGIRVIVSKR